MARKRGQHESPRDPILRAKRAAHADPESDQSGGDLAGMGVIGSEREYAWRAGVAHRSRLLAVARRDGLLGVVACFDGL